ncbi:TetR/AcrR family transcriptional regulator [Pontibacter ruber]|uniref:TetR/AcrR family transcriptional regulator n=1 Tax=Pontibacter ruber TaxID=1343895 RepID=A0ABW5CRX2_9BACT|nr:TetR/AcrR family transcriptional regulator [Pontibacter ruber]
MKSQKKIEVTALRLFAERGFTQTPTALIAKEAGFSEPLIFKYYKSKDQLLEYLIKTGYRRITEQNRGMLTEEDPRALIEKVIDLPYKLVEDERDFWRLQAQLMDKELISKNYQKFIHPVFELLAKAFTRLGYSQPELETYHLLLLIEGLWKKLIQVPEQDHYLLEMKNYMKSKYNLAPMLSKP